MNLKKNLKKNTENQMKYKIIFKEVTIQETTYCVSVDSNSEDNAYQKAWNGNVTEREILYEKPLEILNKQVIAITNE